MHVPCRSALALVVALATIPAHAQQCAGFDDVLATSAFCPNVTWMKNRAITLGCSGTSYCPDELVSRLAMAAFMKRLGDVATPQVLSAEATGSAIASGATQELCVSAEVPAKGYGRTAVGEATLSYDTSGAVDVALRIVRSTNGGAFVPVHTGILPEATDGSRNHEHVIAPVVQLVADGAAAYRFALAVTPGAGQTITGWSCQLLMTVQNAIE